MEQATLLQQAQSLQARHAGLHFYAIADAAQDEKLLDHLRQGRGSMQSKCLLADLGPEADKAAPHLVQMKAPEQALALWRGAMRHAEHMPQALTLIASPQSFGALCKHLAHFTRVRLPDQSEMVLAFWDPAILGTLVGNAKDTTLHVAGPVLAEQQTRSFLAPITAWWYWDRAGQLRRIDGKAVDTETDFAEPMPLDQKQVDMLVEASVPDHVLSYLQQTQPALLNRIEPKDQYPTVRRLLADARTLHLETMQDLVRFVGVSLIYGRQMQSDEAIQKLMDKVQQRGLQLEDALKQFPEVKKGKP